MADAVCLQQDMSATHAQCLQQLSIMDASVHHDSIYAFVHVSFSTWNAMIFNRFVRLEQHLVQAFTMSM